MLESCIEIINREAGNVGSATVGYGCYLVPVFVSVAEKNRSGKESAENSV